MSSLSSSSDESIVVAERDVFTALATSVDGVKIVFVEEDRRVGRDEEGC